MSIYIPENPRRKTQQTPWKFKRRSVAGEQDAMLTKMVYVRTHHRRVGRKRRASHLQSGRLSAESHVIDVSAHVVDRRDLERQEVLAALQELTTKLEESQNRRLRALSTAIAQPFTSIHGRLQASLREAFAIPKVPIPDFKIDRLLDIHRSQQRAASNVARTLLASHSSATREVLQTQIRLAGFSESINPSLKAFHKIIDAHRIVLSSVSKAVTDVLATHQNAMQEVARAHLESAFALEDPSNEDLRCLLKTIRAGSSSPTSEVVSEILKLQSMPVPEEVRTEVILTLIEFIRKNRTTNSQRVLLAVGAAIRKVLLNLPGDDIGLASELLKSEGSLSVPIEVELEVAKMVVHRLRSSPEIASPSLSELGALLANIADLYSKPNLINRDKYGATALNAFLAVLLLKGPIAIDLCKDTMTIAPVWFLDSVRSRLRRMLADFSARSGEEFRDLEMWIRSLPVMADCE